MAAHRVYHYRHGWIPLDHVAAMSKAHGSESAAAKLLHPVSQASLPRSKHVVAGFNSRSGTFVVHDTQTKHTTNLTTLQAGKLRDDGHVISAVHPDGHFATTHADGPTSQRSWSPQDVAVAQKILARAADEEKTLTPLMQRLEGKHAGKLAGLEFKLKSDTSMAEKIAIAVHAKKNISPHEAGAEIFDANRYTMLFNEAKYTAQAQRVIDDLRAQGYKVLVTNYWNVDKRAYQGINMKVTSPNGQRFELQFHTATSLRIKEGELHRLYEKQRVSTDPKEIARLEAEMFRVARQIPVPPGVGHFKG